jgi:hypothetical protein
MHYFPTAVRRQARRVFPAVLGLLPCVLLGAEGPRIVVQPDRIELRQGEREHGLLVTLVGADGRKTDVTKRATFASGVPAVATVGADGACRAAADGQTVVDVAFDGLTARVPVVVSDASVARPPSFKEDIQPILTKAGCNSGGCHGKLAGQNGFRLSLRAFAPEWDHDWLTKEIGARRIDLAFPAQSLLLQKSAGAVAHEGGTRFKAGSRYHRTVLDWIAARAPGPLMDEPAPERLEVLPGDRELGAGDSQRLLVRAHYPGGRVRDVTWLAQFFSNDEGTASVKPDGLVKVLRSGETTIRVHFQGLVEVVRFTMPRDAVVEPSLFTQRQNALDAPIFDKLRSLRIPPAPICDDATFLRRASLDAIGTLPEPEEVAAFLADTKPDKRARLVERLLARPEWVDYWTLQLADLLQNRRERDHDVRGVKGVRSFHGWLRTQLAANKPWSEIARAVLLARGDVATNPQVGYFITVVGEKNRVEESELPDSAAQSFLGTRIGCARCHNHPLERYTQDDFYHLAAFFSKVRLHREKSETGATMLSMISREEENAEKQLAQQRSRLDDARSVALALGEEPGGEEARKAVAEMDRRIVEMEKQLAGLRARPPSVNQPRTGKQMAPQSLDRTPWTEVPGGDPRDQFVDWMLTSGNFSGAMVNRLWRHFFSVGLVEPVDDLRSSNPPSNGELWALLNREFAGHGFDLKHVMRLILTSRAYQLSSDTVADNETDTRFYSHYYARRLPAEVLMDAVTSATGVPQAFAGYPVGLRAIQLPDTSVQSYFLTLFGRSDRVTACACERMGEVTLPQLLHVRNGEDIQRQIGDAGGRLASLLKNPDNDQVARELFLATVARLPLENELKAIHDTLATDQREAVFKDLLWALLNSKEFAFNH